MSLQKVSPRQAKVISSLLANKTIEECARESNVTPRTVHRWLNDSDFKLALFEAESDLIDNAGRRLISLADKALNALESILENPGQDGASPKRLAAMAILDLMLKLRELRTFEERLSELEKVVFHEDS